MGLRDIELTLPPGFRFYPSDEELVCHYLHGKVANEQLAGAGAAMVEVDLHAHEPWELPGTCLLCLLATEFEFLNCLIYLIVSSASISLSRKQDAGLINSVPCHGMSD